MNAAAMPWPELGRIGEILHDGHEAHDRADDAERGRVHAHRLEDLGRLVVEVLHGVELDLHARADRFRLAAVDQRLQSLLQEVVLFPLDRGLEPQQTLLARDVAPLDDLFDHRRRIVRRRLEHPGDDFPGAQEGRQRRLHQACREGAHDDDDERGAADQRAGAAALQDGAADDGDQRQHDADDAEDVHGVQSGVSHSASRARRRTSAWPWIWQTRDSETSSTSPISRRFMSSS